MIVIGLTGGIASGKSTVSKMICDLNIPVIDTDKMAKETLKKGKPAYQKVVEVFTKDILLPGGDINRKKLGRIVFGNEERRQQLNKIVHPIVWKEVELEIKQYASKGAKVVVVDVPLLFESSFDRICDVTICVYTTAFKQLERLMERDYIDETYAKMKIEAQMPLEEKCAKSDFVIDNSRSILETKKELTEILRQLEVI
jgi:dephospho-CoA kinase